MLHAGRNLLAMFDGIGVVAELAEVYSEFPEEIRERIPATSIIGLVAASRFKWLNQWMLKEERNAWARGVVGRPRLLKDAADKAGTDRCLRLNGLPTSSQEWANQGLNLYRDALGLFLAYKKVPAHYTTALDAADGGFFGTWKQWNYERETGQFFVGRLARCLDTLSAIDALSANLAPPVDGYPPTRFHVWIDWALDAVESVVTWFAGPVSGHSWRFALEPVHRFTATNIRLWLRKQWLGVWAGSELWQVYEIFLPQPEQHKRNATLEEPIHKWRLRAGREELEPQMQRWYGHITFRAAFEQTRSETLVNLVKRCVGVDAAMQIWNR